MVYLLLLFGILSVWGVSEQKTPKMALTYEISDLKLTNDPQAVGLVDPRFPSSVPIGVSQQSDNWHIIFRLKNLSDRTITKIHWLLRVENSSDKRALKEFKNKGKIRSLQTTR